MKNDNNDFNVSSSEQDDAVFTQEITTYQKGTVGRKKHLFWKFFALIAGLGMLVLGIVELATGNSLGIMPILIGCGLLPLGIILVVKHFKK